MGSTTTTTTGADHRLPLGSLSVVDLRLLSQPELLALSLASSQDHHADAFPIPKIDRSVFNESAGSRKQTYSRLRLAPSASVAAARRNRAAAAAKPDRRPSLDSLGVVAYLEQLFGSDALMPVPVADPPSQSRYVAPEEGERARPVKISDGRSFPAGDSAPEEFKPGQTRRITDGKNFVLTDSAAGDSAPEKSKRGRPVKISDGISFPALDFMDPCVSAPEEFMQARPRRITDGKNFVLPDSVAGDSAPEKRKRGRPRGKNPAA